MKSHICIYFLIALIGCSCVQELRVEPAKDFPVCVKCILSSSDDIQSLDIVYAAPLNSESFKPVKEATIKLYKVSDSGKTDVASFFYDEGSRWTCNFRPECGSSYRLEISIPGRDLIYSETEVPSPISVDYLSVPAYEDVVSKSESELYPYDFSGNQIFIDELHKEGIKDLCEVMPGPLYRVNADEDVDVIVTAPYSGNRDIFFVPLKIDGFISQTSNGTDLFHGIEDITFTTAGGRVYMSWMTSEYDGANMYQNYFLAHIPEDFQNGLSGVSTVGNLFGTRNFMLLYDNPGVQHEFRVDPRKFFIILALEKWDDKYEIYAKGFSKNYENLTFTRISGELKKYYSDVASKRPQSEITDILEKLYMGDDIYSNVENGSGIFGSTFTTTAQPMQ